MKREKKSTKIINTHLSVYIICVLLFTMIFVIDLFIPLGVAAGVPYIAVVLVSLWIPKRNFTIWVAFVSSVLTITGLFYSPVGGEMWKVLFNRVLALFAIWTTAMLTLQRKTIEEERFRAVQEAKQMLEETKILRGLIPICASCKKIRDDKGYWNQIEIYIEKHSDAHFSHGICKECQDKLYGDQDWYKRKK
ncbi:MAG: hypothetical protein KKE62_06205 [Proteobacteria bacterium]|nr:hypothetical protein [Pseudomonadota bacterium]MBU1542421.1 hypothetical protein [Pseudomonadota bacterium]MBU2482797.1 hypothetical protein [Pseudomonadota bacterium]